VSARKSIGFTVVGFLLSTAFAFIRVSRLARADLSSEVYIDLLNRFAADLRGQGVRLISLGVNGQLKDFPTIAATVKRLRGGGFLRYVDAADWLENEANYAPPAEHRWGKRAHRIIGERLAPLVQEGLLSDSSGPSP
jgi:hypothetical protein